MGDDPQHKTTDMDAWEDAYRNAFRRIARERGWKEEHIESGWLDEWPRDAWVFGEVGLTPEVAAARDIEVAEQEAANV